MKSTLTLTILIVGAALLTGICGDEQTVLPPDHKEDADQTKGGFKIFPMNIPPEHKKEADKTYAAGMHYYIWPDMTNSPITSVKVSGLALGRDAPALMIPIRFKAKDDVPELFSMRIEAVTKGTDSPPATQVTNTMTISDASADWQTSGRAIALLLRELPPGKGKARIHLVKRSDETNPDAKPISNETEVKILVEP